jgi:glycosyltransferase XagB
LPVWMTLITFAPLYCLVMTMCIDLAGLHEFVKVHKRKWRLSEAITLVVAFIPYQFLLGIGAIRAVYRYLKGTSNWEKTAHTGQHRGGAAGK